MGSRHPKRIAVAAWLALLALGVQSLIPVLLAAEIEVAVAQPGQSVFTLCTFGHLHPSAQSANHKSPTDPADDRGQGTLCPICIALQASPPFTAPVQIALPLPSGRPIDVLAATAASVPERVATLAYRSRAPPLA